MQDCFRRTPVSFRASESLRVFLQSGIVHQVRPFGVYDLRLRACGVFHCLVE